MKIIGHTPCFRKESGSYGRDTRGIIRLHQFEKVELVHIVPPEMAEAALEQIVKDAASVLEHLELPYRIVDLCTGDLGVAAQRTFDLEVFLPSANTYREISSCSHFGDYQARRLKARWRTSSEDKPSYLHTLNGSGLPSGRTLVAIMENYQNSDGTITVPKVLRERCGFERIG